MNMQKKVTLKEDGRFLVYYHFPATATEEETQVFAGIQAIEEGEGKREKGKEEAILTPEPVNDGGVPHV